MKKTTILLTLLACGSSHGFIVNLTNISSFGATNNPSFPVVDNTGAPLAKNTGLVRAGFFNILDSEISGAADYATLLADSFVPFTTNERASTNAFPGTINGIFSGLELTEPISAGSQYIGQPIYVVIQQGPTASPDPTFLAVFKSGEVFAADPEGAEGVANVVLSGTLTSDNLIVGRSGGPVSFDGISFDDSIQLVAIPEPSTSLLAALAGLGLIARRRR